MYVRKLVICDCQQAYGKNLLTLFGKLGKGRFQCSLFYEPEEAEKFAETETIDILLVAEEFSAERRYQIRAKRRFVLCSEVHTKLEKQERGVFRYQRGEKILKDLLTEEEVSPAPASEAVGAEVPLQEVTRRVGGKEGRLIGVYSPIHRLGKTKFALEYGRKQAEKHAVLYLNLEPYAYNLRMLRGAANKGQHLGDLLYRFRQKQERLGLQVRMFAEQKGNLDYILPMPYIQDLKGVRGEEWLELFSFLQEQCIYEEIVLDLSDCVDGLFQILEKCAQIYMPVMDGVSARDKLAQYTENIRKSGLESILEKTVQKRIKNPIPERRQAFA